MPDDIVWDTLRGAFPDDATLDKALAEAEQQKLLRKAQPGPPRESKTRGNGRIFLRGQIWWAAYYLRGKEYRESTGETDDKKAGKFLQHKLKEVGADQIGWGKFVEPKSQRLTVDHLLEGLRKDFELRGKLDTPSKGKVARAKADFGHHRAVSLTAQHVDKYIEQRLEAGDRPATINRITQLLGQAYKLAIQRGELNAKPHIRHLSEAGNARQGFLTAEQIEAVIVHLPEDLRDFTAWCAATGMRKGEAAGLTWNMVHGDELHIPGSITKNRQPRVLPVVGQLADIIARRQTARPTEVHGTTVMAERVFHRRGQPVRNFRKAWDAACGKAGVHAIFHDLRRSAVRRMVRAGIAPQIAKRWSGHASDSMFQRYAILTTDDMREAFETTQNFREPAQTKVVAIK
jgi:integrase